MAMETRLNLRQTQRLVMTPLLQQAIQLLQLSTVELQELLQKELTENPLLEEVSPDEEREPTAPDIEPPREPQPPEASPSLNDGQPPDLPFDLAQFLFDTHDEPTLVQQEEREEVSFENFVGATVTMTDHLRQQLRLVAETPDALLIGEAIIGNLDDDGYLRATVEEIATATGATTGRVEEILALVQTFDPPGVAARDLRECLLIQLRGQPEPDPLAIDILADHFADLERCRYPEIARALRMDIERVVEAVDEIARLEPKPGRRFHPSDTRYIVPDVFVHKTGDGYAIVLNDEGLPRLRVNAYYRSMLGRGAADETRAYVESKLRSALWLIKSVHQRQRTLYRVTESIVRFQKEFLDRGLSHLRPLSLRDVAEDIGMHESTISRVTTSKYVQTPQGLFELKYFFHSRISTGKGDVVSSLSVKKLIADLIAQEDPAKALSDQDITRVLRERGLTIARRTVAKYREELGILPSHQRRVVATRKRG